MDFDLSLLLYTFGFSIVIGFAFGILYEPIRIFHFCGYKKSSHYFVTDIGFMILAGMITYFYALVTLEGKVRMFIIIGELLGFSLYFKLVAPVTRKIFSPIINFCKKISTKLLKKCRDILYNTGRKFGCFLRVLYSALKSFGRKVNNRVKKDERKQSRKARNSKNKRSKNNKEKI